MAIPELKSEITNKFTRLRAMADLGWFNKDGIS